MALRFLCAIWSMGVYYQIDKGVLSDNSLLVAQSCHLSTIALEFRDAHLSSKKRLSVMGQLRPVLTVFLFFAMEFSPASAHTKLSHTPSRLGLIDFRTSTASFLSPGSGHSMTTRESDEMIPISNTKPFEKPGCATSRREKSRMRGRWGTVLSCLRAVLVMIEMNLVGVNMH